MVLQTNGLDARRENCDTAHGDGRVAEYEKVTQSHTMCISYVIHILSTFEASLG